MATWTVQFSREAIAELMNAIEYYDLQNIGLGEEFKAEFEKQIRQITVNPFTRAVRNLNVRFALTDRFPYAIHYTIKEDTGMVIVQTVLSTYKNPDVHWKQR